ncbi:MAG: PrsW family intramembrane metalloprotease [Bacteroidales bacterium]|nr:PrsW family intramembrane metalloprotease [Bacteroidales bacterium]MCB8999862.1 PrsW family intramembrane metalloprotease [Bacteroidales bacterium]
MQILFLSLAPVFVILFYVYFRDKYEKEPFQLLFKALLVGCLIVIPVFFTERFFELLNPGIGAMGDAFYTSFIVAGVTEEVFKFAGLYFLIWRNPEFNEKFDGIVYAVFVSLGFAAVENILYVAEGGSVTAIVRALTAVPAHALFGIRMGYYFGIAHMYEELRKPFLIKALMVPIVLHGIYDFLILSKNSLLLLIFLPYLVWLFFAGFKEMKVTSDSSIFKPSER